MLARLEGTLAAQEVELQRNRDSVQHMRTLGSRLGLLDDVVSNVTGTIANAWYDDELTRTENGLQIQRRTVRMISMRTIGPNLAAEM